MLKTLAGDLIPLKSRQFVYREAAALLGVGQEDLTLFRNDEILPEDHSEIQASEVLCVLIEPFSYTITFDYAIWCRGSEEQQIEQLKYFDARIRLRVGTDNEVVFDKNLPLMGYMHDEKFVLEQTKEPIFDVHLLAIKQHILPVLHQLEPRRQIALEERLAQALKKLEKLLWERF